MASSDPNHRVIDPVGTITNVNNLENDVTILFEAPKLEPGEKVHLRAFGIGATKFLGSITVNGLKVTLNNQLVTDVTDCIDFISEEK